MARNKEVNAALEAEGWTVIRFWERQIRKELDKCVDEVMKIMIIKNNKLIRSVSENNVNRIVLLSEAELKGICYEAKQIRQA